jgi:hypothetical protein
LHIAKSHEHEVIENFLDQPIQVRGIKKVPGLKTTFRAIALPENHGTFKTSATLLLLLTPEARHIDSLPCVSSLGWCSEMEVI